MIELLNIDCMAYMKTLDDNAFDLAIVDPPYFEGPNNIGYYGKGYSNPNMQMTGTIPSQPATRIY